jgi:hypothetical protein
MFLPDGHIVVSSEGLTMGPLLVILFIPPFVDGQAQAVPKDLGPLLAAMTFVDWITKSVYVPLNKLPETKY